MMATLTEDDFARHFGIAAADLPQACRDLILSRDFRYRVLSGHERDATILRVLKALNSDLEASGPGRQPRWQAGWSENLKEFIESNYDPAKLVPKFVRRKEIIRLEGNYVLPNSETFETDYVCVLRAWLFSHFFRDVAALYEFGVGSGHNLVEAAKYLPSAKLVGLDWAPVSRQILENLRRHCGLNVEGHVFDLNAPDRLIAIERDAGVLTIGTLEQMGGNFGPFVDFLLDRRPKVCVHVETLYEVYDQDNLVDWLAAAYLEKRNYLRGFLAHLREMEAQRRIRILDLRRTFGSFYHDGYTYLAWQPL